MNFERSEPNHEEISYSEELELSLEIGTVVDQLVTEFDGFLERNNLTPTNELGMLRAIKIFIYREEKRVREITTESIISGFDCLTLSIITCLIAHRKGYNTTIGRPDNITRYFHSLIIKQDGEMFKVAGRNRNYPIKEMDAEDVIARLKAIGPVINTVDKIKKRFDNL